MGISVINVYNNNEYKASNNQYICRELDEEIYWQPVKRIFVMNDEGQWKAAQYPSASNNPDEPNYPTSFAEATWEQIIQACKSQADILNTWSVGESHSLYMSDGSISSVTILGKTTEIETGNTLLILGINKILFQRQGSNYFNDIQPTITDDDEELIKSYINEPILTNNIKTRVIELTGEGSGTIRVLPKFFNPTYKQIEDGFKNISDRIRFDENLNACPWWTSTQVAETIPEDDGSGFNPEDYPVVDVAWWVYVNASGESEVLRDNYGLTAGICPAFWI